MVVGSCGDDNSSSSKTSPKKGPKIVSGHKKEESVYVSKLTLTDFRCYSRAVLAPKCNRPLVILTGPNGAGKTNILEAISYLAPGRGLRRAGHADVARQTRPAGENGSGKTIGSKDGPENDNDETTGESIDKPLQPIGSWAVAATLNVGSEPVKVGTGIEGKAQETTTKRTVRIDGNTVANSNMLGERWSISWLTPQMDRLFIEGPASRRRFLDRMVLGLFPDHSRQVGAYERAMRERNRLLAEKGPAADPAWLNALETRMGEHGVAVAVARLEFAGQLAGQLANADTGPFPKAELAIDGWLEGLIAGAMPAVEAEQAFRERLRAERSGQRSDGGRAEYGRSEYGRSEYGRSGSGVHKTDLVVSHAPKAMRADLCSTGEQKALLVALVLANARLQKALKGQAPLMLMDEVAAHLDKDRRVALFEVLASLGSQCWLTGTDASLFEGVSDKAEFFNVFDGAVQPLEA